MSDAPSEAEKRLYREVLARGGWMTFREAGEQDIGSALRLLELGLLFHYEFDDTLNAVNPRVAVDRVSTRLRETSNRLMRQAEAAEAGMEDLSQAYDALIGRRNHTNVVRHIDRNVHIRHRIVQIEAEMREERLAAQPGGARPHKFLKQSLEQARQFLAAGIALRTLYAPGARTDEPTAEYCADVNALGEQTRILAEPFTRLLIYDRRVAIIPASPDNRGAAVFIEDPAVVAVLVDRFERDWARAERVDWRALAGRPRQAGVPDELGALLAQGLTQRAIASRLGLSERTVAGHIARLREFYDAETLFQLGWQLRGARERPNGTTRPGATPGAADG
ncbi:LuxR C-terminal-related transcriptional regulator [Streptomyces sp. TLI_171]|uniref:LuxR C-terminal-related transcriptional regulator n=1 Tax=Streptomyces sp. TLI_171 TaxID=1938859 RepID=UPI000C19AF02|nr:LuxR C-terminal-related transcriptional regulator [Streptomyces sp. TLI_171]RKE20198.1 regulatory LuxR family protein [Streptomyces sp. TLI_171]